MPGKLCTGTFSDATRQTLAGNRNRAQWQMYPCEECGLPVGARQEKGTWLPEAHWQSVAYSIRPGRPPQPRPGTRSAGCTTSDRTVVVPARPA